VGKLLACGFRVVDRDSSGFVRAFADVLGGIGSIAAHNVKSVVGAISGLDDNGLAVCAHMSDGAVDGVHSIFANFIDLDGSFFPAFRRVMSDNFGTFRESMERILGAGGGDVRAVDRGFGNEMKRVFGAISGFDGNSLGGCIDLRDGAMDSCDYVFVRSGGKNEEGSKSKQAKRKFEHKNLGSAIETEVHSTGNSIVRWRTEERKSRRSPPKKNTQEDAGGEGRGREGTGSVAGPKRKNKGVDSLPYFCKYRNMTSALAQKNSEQVAKLADMLSAMGTEPRLRIMQLLLSAHPEGLVVGDIQEELEIPNSTLSHHLDKLKNENLVQVKRESTFLRYTANTEALQQLMQFLWSECCTRNKALRPRDIIEICQ
jgi:ArsR family transcriptional regulator, arsenate/arsenite/antimonite-responsive transcriptional repressor